MPPAFRVVATDLDGTILGGDGAVSPRVRDALRRATAAGALVVVATARPPRWIPSEVLAHSLSGLLICANGALIVETSPWQLLFEATISPELSGAVVDAVRAVRPGAAFAVEYLDGFGREPQFVGSRAPELGAVIAGVHDLVRRPVAKMLVQDRVLDTALLRAVTHEALADTVHVTESGLAGIVEIGPAGVSKASALARICAERRISRDQVLAFGDMPNDAEMLTWAGWGVAVGNAHPDLRCAADEVTAGVDEDGVAVVLERYFAFGS